MQIGQDSLDTNGRRTSRTRSRIRDAAFNLFCDRPSDAVSIDDIVGEAGVAKGSFYNHFRDKLDLLDTIFTDIRAEIESEVARVNEGIADPASRVCRAISVYAAAVSDRPRTGQFLLRNDPRGSSRSELNEGLRRDLEQGLHDGRLLMSGIEPGLLFVVGIAHSVLLGVVRHNSSARAQIDVQQLCMMMLRGFGIGGAEAELLSAQASNAIFTDRRNLP